MANQRLGQNDSQVLLNFRRVAVSYGRLFEAPRDHIRNLLGPNYNYQSGIFREALIRDFFTEILPESVSVDTGFIYGFVEEVENSKQLDVIIWDSARHSPVYRTKEFVILPAESVISVLSVKTNLTTEDIQHGLANLLSVVPLDLAYRGGVVPATGEPICPPISKFLVSYNGASDPSAALYTIATFCQDVLRKDESLLSSVVTTLQEFDPMRPESQHVVLLERVFRSS